MDYLPPTAEFETVSVSFVKLIKDIRNYLIIRLPTDRHVRT